MTPSGVHGGNHPAGYTEVTHPAVYRTGLPPSGVQDWSPTQRYTEVTHPAVHGGYPSSGVQWYTSPSGVQGYTSPSGVTEVPQRC